MVIGSTKLSFIRKEMVTHDPTPPTFHDTEMDMEGFFSWTRPPNENHQDPPLLQEMVSDETYAINIWLK